MESAGARALPWVLSQQSRVLLVDSAQSLERQATQVGQEQSGLWGEASFPPETLNGPTCFMAGGTGHVNLWNRSRRNVSARALDLAARARPDLFFGVLLPLRPDPWADRRARDSARLRIPDRALAISGHDSEDLVR